MTAWADANAEGIALAFMVSVAGVAVLLVAAAIEAWMRRRHGACKHE